ncbi:hypothetical protein MesoLjLb_51840 [Mesorhizobium sp. L-8-3]|nr:hypothetical protein MesoLjLb_51840 [Mesorhizobium sp. L-8-3]
MRRDEWVFVRGEMSGGGASHNFPAFSANHRAESENPNWIFQFPGGSARELDFEILSGSIDS